MMVGFTSTTFTALPHLFQVMTPLHDDSEKSENSAAAFDFFKFNRLFGGAQGRSEIVFSQTDSFDTYVLCNR